MNPGMPMQMNMGGPMPMGMGGPMHMNMGMPMPMHMNMGIPMHMMPGMQMMPPMMMAAPMFMNCRVSCEMTADGMTMKLRPADANMMAMLKERCDGMNAMMAMGAPLMMVCGGMPMLACMPQVQQQASK
jgi:hypothetical protein